MGQRTGRLTVQVAGEPARLAPELFWVSLLTGSPHAVSAPPPTSIRAVVNAMIGRRSSMARHYEHLHTGARRAAYITLLTSL